MCINQDCFYFDQNSAIRGFENWNAVFVGRKKSGLSDVLEENTVIKRPLGSIATIVPGTKLELPSGKRILE